MAPLSASLIRRPLKHRRDMKVEYINPFVNALSSAFSTMLDCSTTRGALTLKQGGLPMHEYSGLIGLSGTAMGMVVLSLSREVATHATAAMLMATPDQVSENEIVDAVGELANMVAGAAKAKLVEHNMSVSLPSVIKGTGSEVRFPSNVTPICVPFTCAWGPLTLEVGLTAVNQPAMA